MKNTMRKEEKERRGELSKRWLRHNKKRLLPASIFFTIAFILALVLPHDLALALKTALPAIPAFVGLFRYYQFLAMWEKAVEEEYKKEKGTGDVSPDIQKGR